MTRTFLGGVAGRASCVFLVFRIHSPVAEWRTLQYWHDGYSPHIFSSTLCITMAKVNPYYSTTNETPKVYHDDNACPYGKQIKPENRASGTDGRQKCDWCKA